MEDLRSIKTEKAIEDALMELIETKGFSNIKIKDIAEKANVNRNTIYLHYNSKEEIVTKMLAKAYGQSDFAGEVISLISGRFDRKTAKAFLNKMLNAIESNIELYRVLMTDPGLNGYVLHSIDIIRHKVLKVVKQTEKNRIRVDYVISGISGVIMRWIVYAIATKEEIEEELINLTLGTIRRIAL